MRFIEILCLADSRKPGGHCIAGIDMATGLWVRPVKDECGGGLSSYDIQYNNGGAPALLDIIKVPVLYSHPLYYQPENWLVVPGKKWQKTGEIHKSQLETFLENDYTIFLDDSDKLTEEECRDADNLTSLILIKMNRLHIEKRNNPWGSRDKVRAIFKYNIYNYDLAITDFKWETAYLKSDVLYGTYVITGPLYLTISLGEKFPVDGCHYKLVSGIIK